MDRKKVIKGMELLYDRLLDAAKRDAIAMLDASMVANALALLKEQDKEHRRLLSWLGKFCRHIDNGDAWLTDEVMKNKDDYEKEIKELITELAIEKQKQISNMKSELQVQTAILDIQHQNAMMQTQLLKGDNDVHNGQRCL